MLKKGMVPVFCAAALLSISAQGAEKEMTQNEMDALDKGCETIHQKVITRDEASACVTPFYNATVDKGFEIKYVLENSAVSDDPRVLRALREFNQKCEPRPEEKFENYGSAEEFLRQPRECLALMSNTADRFDVDYDYDGAAFLHGRLRVLRQLSFLP
jgi:hypothetical protein